MISAIMDSIEVQVRNPRTGRIDAVPALLAGSAVIVKPSEFTPHFIEPFMDILAGVAGLAAVFRFLPGDGSLGPMVVLARC